MIIEATEQMWSQSRPGELAATARELFQFASTMNSVRSLRAGLGPIAKAKRESAVVGLAVSKTSAIVAGTTKTTARTGIRAGA